MTKIYMKKLLEKQKNWWELSGKILMKCLFMFINIIYHNLLFLILIVLLLLLSFICIFFVFVIIVIIDNIDVNIFF